MKRLFREPQPGPSGYAALMVFALAYIGVMAMVIAPDQVTTLLDAPFGQEAH
jgi:hypothetical protein